MVALPFLSAPMHPPNLTDGRASLQRSSTQRYQLTAGPSCWQGTSTASSILRMWSSLRTSPSRVNGLASKALQLCGKSWLDPTFKMYGGTATRMVTTSPIGILRLSRVRGLIAGWYLIVFSNSAPPSLPPSSLLLASVRIIARYASLSNQGVLRSLRGMAFQDSLCCS